MVLSLVIEIGIITVLLILNIRVISKATPNVVLLFIIWTVVRIALLYYQTQHGDLPMSGTDWGVFHSNAINIMNNAHGLLDLLNPSATMINRGDFYERIVAVVYTFLGVRTTYMYLFSYIMSETTFLLIYKISLEVCWDYNRSIIAAMIFYLWPMETIYSVAFLREMAIQCCFAISLLFFVRFLKRSRIWNIVLALFFAYFCAGMHSGMVAVFAGYIAVFFFYSPRTKEIKITLPRIVCVLGFIILVYGSGILNGVTARFNNISSIGDVNAKLDSVEANTDYIGSAGSTWGAILQTPLRLFYYIASPLFWQVRSGGTLIAFVLDGILRDVLIYRVYKNYTRIKESGTEYETLFKSFLILWLMTDLVFSWGTNNFGTAMRHRLKIFPVEIMLMYVLGRTSGLVYGEGKK